MNSICLWRGLCALRIIREEVAWSWATASPLVDDEGNIIGAIESIRDITERKRNEEELDKYRERLEYPVERRTAELKEINKELESFSYSVSHDLRAPLRIIDGYSHVLEEDYLEKLDDAGMKNIQIIRAQCQRMGDLINDLLDLSRLSRKEMQLEEVNLSQLAESIAGELQDREPERQVAFIIAPDVKVYCDKQLLRSVLENLFNNSWKFTSKHTQAEIEFGVKENDSKKAYFVRDDGAGFDMKYAQKLFGAFQRLHTSRRVSRHRCWPGHCPADRSPARRTGMGGRRRRKRGDFLLYAEQINIKEGMKHGWKSDPSG